MSRFLFAVKQKPSARVRYTDIKSFGNHAVALKEDFTIWTWGNNQNGQLGDNTTTSKLLPVQIAGSPRSYTTIDCGANHSLAIDSNNVAWAWGNNQNGQLGDNTNTSRLTPVSIVGGNIFLNISGGETHTLAIDNTGDGVGVVYSWGSNTYGELGNNNNTNLSSPISIATIKLNRIVSAGKNYSLMLDADGVGFAWGYNNKGQLGDGTTTSRLTPVSIIYLDKTFSEISANSDFNVAYDNLNAGWAWGNNDVGQLGDDTLVSKLSPVFVNRSEVSFISITNGDAHSLAVDIDGNLWVWGKNNVGQLGDNTTTSKTIPTAIFVTNTTFTKVAAGNEVSYALDTNGRIWAWGSNSFGKLGINAATTESRLTPTLVG